MSDSIRLSSVAINCPNSAELAAGASQYDCQPNHEHCSVFADTAGHPSCLSTWEELTPDQAH